MTRQLLACVFMVLASHAAAGPLHDAVKKGDIEQVKVLIANGEDVNENDRSLGTALHRAAISGSAEIAELLIAEGADVNIENRGLSTPLQAAVRKGSEAVTAVLIANGAAVEARHRDGKTPLQAAAEKGHASVVELLIAHGADVNARGVGSDARASFSAVHFAAVNAHFDVVELLRAYGARGPAIEPISGLLATASTKEGETVFKDVCAECHTLERDKTAGSHHGPSLWGILGRKKASVEGFLYSMAFSRLVGNWTIPELNAFVASPGDYVPGTQMGADGYMTSVNDRNERANLIAFLRLQSDEPLPVPGAISGK